MVMKTAMSHEARRPPGSHRTPPPAGSCLRHLHPGGSKIIFILQARLREGQEMNASPSLSPIPMTLHPDVTDSRTALTPPQWGAGILRFAVTHAAFVLHKTL